jgi:tight adherence protein C
MFALWLLLCCGFGLGLFLIVTGQEWWERPRPDLWLQLRRLSVEGRYALEREASRGSTPVYRASVLERLLRPVADDLGRLLSRVAAHLGIGGVAWERKLTRAGYPMPIAQFLGQKVIAGLALFAVFPLANLLDFTVAGPWPVEVWLGGFAVGFLLPDWLVEGRLRARREQLRRELPIVLDLLSIAISAGMGLEQALQTVANQGEGVLLDQLKDLVREMGLGQCNTVELLAALEREDEERELGAVVGALRSALVHGTSLGEMLGVQAETVRERQRADLIAAGGRATVRMLLPVGLLILPAYILVILFPAAIQILGLVG